MSTLNLANKVWILVINHEHGIGTHAHRTEEGAKRILYAYVKQYWNDKVGADIPVPEDIDEVIDLYFNSDKGSPEWYDLNVCEIEG